jgi:prefoldin subunit 5
MSTNPPPPPPDRPTQRLQPTAPPPPPPVHEERVVAPAADTSAILLRLEDAIGSLRTGLMVVGVIAVAALGVAIYSLMQDDDTGTGSRSGLATDERVSRLDDRIDRISRQVQGLRSGGGESSDAVEERVAALEGTVKDLAERPSADPQQAIDELSDRIDDVAQDVEALKQAQPAP